MPPAHSRLSHPTGPSSRAALLLSVALAATSLPALAADTVASVGPTPDTSPPPTAAKKEPCSVEAVKAQLAQRSKTLAAAINNVFSAQCGTFENVLRRLSSKKDAGRKLKKAQPLDPVAAQAQLATARANPAFQAALASELDGVTDDFLRKVLEVALLEEYRYNAARDLLMLDLEQRVATGSGS